MAFPLGSLATVYGSNLADAEYPSAAFAASRHRLRELRFRFTPVKNGNPG
jgi:hypothetical protein